MWFFAQCDNVRIKLEIVPSSCRIEETYILTETDVFKLDVRESHRPFLDFTSWDSPDFPIKSSS